MYFLFCYFVIESPCFTYCVHPEQKEEGEKERLGFCWAFPYTHGNTHRHRHTHGHLTLSKEREREKERQRRSGERSKADERRWPRRQRQQKIFLMRPKTFILLHKDIQFF